jgi:hypothetical protein
VQHFGWYWLQQANRQPSLVCWLQRISPAPLHEQAASRATRRENRSPRAGLTRNRPGKVAATNAPPKTFNARERVMGAAAARANSSNRSFMPFTLPWVRHSLE